MVTWALLAFRQVLIAMVTHARTLVLLAGLLLLHVGLRSVDAWAPGAAWSVPGAIVTAVAIFGARGGLPPAKRVRE